MVECSQPPAQPVTYRGRGEPAAEQLRRLKHHYVERRAGRRDVVPETWAADPHYAYLDGVIDGLKLAADVLGVDL